MSSILQVNIEKYICIEIYFFHRVFLLLYRYINKSKYFSNISQIYFSMQIYVFNHIFLIHNVS